MQFTGQFDEAYQGPADAIFVMMDIFLIFKSDPRPPW